MSGDEVQVLPADLGTKANQIRVLKWSTLTAQPTVVTPDALATSEVALANLTANTEAMWAFQEFGRLEGLRLAQTLDNVAAAYAAVDEISGEDIANTLTGPDAPGSPAGTRFPEVVDLPNPPHPPSMPIPKGQLVSEQMLFPPEAQRALESGDHGVSLRAAAELWRGNAQSLSSSAGQFETNSLLWEGEAADAAYAKFNAYRDWLVGLAGSWRRLAGEADRIAEAHSVARRDNEPVAEEFDRLQQEIAQSPSSADNLRKTLQMAALQNQSEEIRIRYARDGQPRQIQPEDPPSPVVSGIPVTVDDHRRAGRTLPSKVPNQPPGSVAAGNAGPPTAGEARVGTEQAAVSPTSAVEQAGLGAPPGGSQGGSQSGGSPGTGQQGAGSPGGGQPGSRAPGGGTPTGPKGPFDPRLRPAASAGGGSGGGSGGGGAGTGSPLQPSVGAETVAPLIAPVTPAAAPAVAPGSGMAAGGVGGMAPMMHGAKGEANGDKKRNPEVSQDEQLYSEDRPWTEALIGNRVRRKAAPDDSRKESQ